MIVGQNIQDDCTEVRVSKGSHVWGTVKKALQGTLERIVSDYTRTDMTSSLDYVLVYHRVQMMLSGQEDQTEETIEILKSNPHLVQPGTLLRV